MKGHDALCPTSYPHLKDRKNCAYCNLIKDVRDYYKSQNTTEFGGAGKDQPQDKTYEDGYRDGINFSISKLHEGLTVGDV